MSPLRFSGYDAAHNDTLIGCGYGRYHIEGKHGFDTAIQPQIGTTLSTPSSTATDPKSTQTNPRTAFRLFFNDAYSNAPCTREAAADYGGSAVVSGANPIGVVFLWRLNSDDSAANGKSCACPSSAAGSGSGAVAGGTQTGTTGGTPPEVLFSPGNLQGGNQGRGANFTGDAQCYSPYVVGSSQATGAGAPGTAYEARPTTDATIPTANRITGGRNATWFVPNTSGSGAVAPAGCSGPAATRGPTAPRTRSCPESRDRLRPGGPRALAARRSAPCAPRGCHSGAAVGWPVHGERCCG